MRYFLLMFLLGFAGSSAMGIDSIKRYGPIIPNKIADKYIPAAYQNMDSYLGYRFKINLEKRLLQIDSATILSGFRKRPGEQVWIGEHVGKFLYSASKTYACSHDGRIKHLMEDMVQKYIVCQMPDGYLGTYLVQDRWTQWDVWAHKYAMIGLLNYYSVTGDKRALETARRAADLICRTFGQGPGQRDLMLAGEHAGLAPGSILEPMVDLYRYTGEIRYLDFCKYILLAFEQQDGPKIISSLEKYGQVSKIGDAKAYEMLSCFLGMLKYYQLSGESKYLTCLQAAWADIAQHHLYITGTASDHEIFPSDGSLRASNSDNMGEGCVTVTWIQFNLALLQITGNTKYAAELERAVYNHLLAAENPQTGCVSYYTALQGAKPYRCDQGYSCCLSSVPRGISLIPEMIAGNIDQVFTVLMFEGGQTRTRITAEDHSTLQLSVKAASQFPAAGKIVYTITPSVKTRFPIDFRVPDWADNFNATIGKRTYSGKKGQVLRIKRLWAAGDRIKVTFRMPIEEIPGGPSFPNSVAIKRGPQVLAIDMALNPQIHSLEDIKRLQYHQDLTNAGLSLPIDWDWKQAYYLTMQVTHSADRVILVPFSEAGQKSSAIAVWINR